jgi:hypothetical protein
MTSSRWTRIFEIANPKHQIPNKFQITNLNVPNVGFQDASVAVPRTAPRGLGFGAGDLFGIWNLEFGISLRLCRVKT